MLVTVSGVYSIEANQKPVVLLQVDFFSSMRWYESKSQLFKKINFFKHNSITLLPFRNVILRKIVQTESLPL